jgi:hypothetical protein
MTFEGLQTVRFEFFVWQLVRWRGEDEAQGMVLTDRL